MSTWINSDYLVVIGIMISILLVLNGLLVLQLRLHVQRNNELCANMIRLVTIIGAAVNTKLAPTETGDLDEKPKS
jgi:hypothetical protein